MIRSYGSMGLQRVELQQYDCLSILPVHSHMLPLSIYHSLLSHAGMDMALAFIARRQGNEAAYDVATFAEYYGDWKAGGYPAKRIASLRQSTAE